MTKRLAFAAAMIAAVAALTVPAGASEIRPVAFAVAAGAASGTAPVLAANYKRGRYGHHRGHRSSTGKRFGKFGAFNRFGHGKRHHGRHGTEKHRKHSKHHNHHGHAHPKKKVIVGPFVFYR